MTGMARMRTQHRFFPTQATMAETESNHLSTSAGNTEPNNTNCKGIAAIKPQFLTTREKFHEFLDSGGNTAEKKTDSEEPKAEGGDDAVAEKGTGEPEPKRIKLDEWSDKDKKEGEKQQKKRAKGQNKSRPHVKPNAYDDKRLCPSVVQECAAKCFFGDKCKYLHDIPAYLKLKPADVGNKCYLHENFGKCQYGITCRFAKAHIGENFKNMVNEELVKNMEGKVMVKNALSKELQQNLRKRKFDFKASDAYLRQMSKGNKHGNVGKKDTDHQSVPEKVNEKSCTAEGQNNSSIGDPKDSLNSDTQPVVNTEAVLGIPCASEVGNISSSFDSQVDCGKNSSVKTLGAVTDEDIVKLRACEKKQVDFRDKLYLAPLTTCGNLPFRRICKRFGADITCGEMAMCTNLLQGQSSEWALLKRHHTEDIFGVQLEGSFPDTMTKCAELLNQTIDVDFVDINVGCPIDLVYKKGGGCGLMTRTNKFEQIVKGMNSVLDVPLTVKIRTGVQEKVSIAHKLIPDLKNWGVSLVTLHGRSREQRYTKSADWEYIDHCSKVASPMPLFGNGDILSYEDAMRARETGVSGIMIARGALIKPWIFTEIKEQRHWDISSSERFDNLKDFTNFGLEHWGSDTQGVEKTRKFILEWLSFLCRYIPVGLLEHVPQKLNERPPFYLGRDYLESLMASHNVGDWIKISEMLLGPVPSNFTFLPKHKANSYK
ncbi:tRNA-dihydrouridine(47) synthase [NAD(P)(+)]-like isoform X2 [Acipenser ruthenus]|uniref:tRNA-dihydrouridine(47) synthase [NAD(P)(+)]-like isoform X2 n=1 Tax=Acipenser ruthenus TaxID=7906 RepID=UPI00274168B6|nr:tRNA-dihydrouridine(47) synthase [NAD(P)(+)]-like isoform X2 [Acipenser ruthenus]